VACCKVLSQHIPGRTEEKRESLRVAGVQTVILKRETQYVVAVTLQSYLSSIAQRPNFQLPLRSPFDAEEHGGTS
jgi:hypothetical protein